jgi:hypothetical protein
MIKSRYSAAITDKPWWLAGGIPASGCYAAYRAKGAANQAASLTNLNRPGTYTLTAGGAPGWASATGWTFDGTDDYYDTSILNYKSGSWIVKYSDFAAQTSPAFGAYEPTIQCTFYPKYTDNNQYFRMGQNLTRAAPADFASGVAAATSMAAYWNGVNVGAITTVYAGSGTITIYIGSMNPYTSASASAIYIQAIAFYSAVLTNDQIAALTIAMNAL